MKSELSGGVDRVIGTLYAFAAVKQDGSVITWGQSRFGGNSDDVKSELSGGVDRVVGNFVRLRCSQWHFNKFSDDSARPEGASPTHDSALQKLARVRPCLMATQHMSSFCMSHSSKEVRGSQRVG